MDIHHCGLVLPADYIDVYFKLAAQQLARRQNEHYSERVSDTMATIWSARLLSRQFGLQVSGQPHLIETTIYDGGYHNSLIQLGVDTHLLTQVQDLMSRRLLSPELLVELRYKHRSFYLTVSTPD